MSEYDYCECVPVVPSCGGVNGSSSFGLQNGTGVVDRFFLIYLVASGCCRAGLVTFSLHGGLWWDQKEGGQCEDFVLWQSFDKTP